MADDAERIKLRWRALEILAPATTLGTTADVVHLCRVVDQLIDFAQTGKHPRLNDSNGRETEPPGKTRQH